MKMLPFHFILLSAVEKCHAREIISLESKKGKYCSHFYFYCKHT